MVQACESVEGHATPPPDAGVATVYVRSCRPAAPPSSHSFEQAPQAPQVPSQSMGFATDSDAARQAAVLAHAVVVAGLAPRSATDQCLIDALHHPCGRHMTVRARLTLAPRFAKQPASVAATPSSLQVTASAGVEAAVPHAVGQLAWGPPVYPCSSAQ
jgi:hypothetical protein